MALPLIPEQRQQELLRMLRDSGVLSTRELTGALGVSHMTIRRDIASLQAAGRVEAVAGGVRLLPEHVGKEPPRQRVARSALEVPRKRGIARTAATLVEDGMVVFLDAGTTCEALALELLRHRRLTIVTNDFHTVATLSVQRGPEVIHTGGVVDPDSASASGSLAAGTVRGLGIDLYFMSTGTWDIAHGVTTPQADTVVLKQAGLEVAARTVLLADSTKFGDFERFRVAELADLDAVITDAGLPDADREAARAASVTLRIADLP
ncbi:MAG: DeoR/GlpR family DNA-binding transcription regulator [Micropruina sp.]|uniref:DeoR/GlpR family DNA-binding transcription regulator n=1 Tax=Micropruina sp. TaxID=2737536 RepID=UPI0039E46FE8